MAKLSQELFPGGVASATFDWAVDYAVVANGPPETPNVAGRIYTTRNSTVSAAGKYGMSHVVDSISGQIGVRAVFFLTGSPSGTSAMEICLRSTTQDGSGDQYFFHFGIDAGGANIFKRLAGVAGSAKAQAAGANLIVVNNGYEVYFSAEGTTTTVLKAFVRDMITGKYLQSDSTWQYKVAPCCTYSDSTSPLTAAGYYGVSTRIQAGTGTWYVASLQAGSIQAVTTGNVINVSNAAIKRTHLGWFEDTVSSPNRIQSANPGNAFDVTITDSQYAYITLDGASPATTFDVQWKASYDTDYNAASFVTSTINGTSVLAIVGMPYGSNDLKVILKNPGTATADVRYTGTVIGIQGIELESGSSVSAPSSVPTLLAMSYCDSIGEGQTANPTTAVSSYVFAQDATQTFLHIAMKLLNYYYAPIAFSGQGVYPTINSVPPLTTTYDAYFAISGTKKSRISGGVFVTQPDLVIIEEGHNDGTSISGGPQSSGNFQTAYSTVVTGIRTAAPNAIIICMVPFSGVYRTEITAVVAAAGSKVFLLDLGTLGLASLGNENLTAGSYVGLQGSYDEIHPTKDYHKILGGLVAQALRQILAPFVGRSGIMYGGRL